MHKNRTKTKRREAAHWNLYTEKLETNNVLQIRNRPINVDKNTYEMCINNVPFFKRWFKHGVVLVLANSLNESEQRGTKHAEVEDIGSWRKPAESA